MKERGETHRTAPAPFLTKTYQLVEDPETDDIVSWGEDGSTFVVWKPAEFATDLLPNYFKHNNFASFVRQLNTYGFRKIVPDRWEFANDNFRRAGKALLWEIQRKKAPFVQSPAIAGSKLGTSPPPPSSSSTANTDEEQASSSISSSDTPQKQHYSGDTAQMSDLSDENEKLKKENRLLCSELAQAKNQCQELLSFLSGSVKVSPDLVNVFVQGEARKLLWLLGGIQGGSLGSRTDAEEAEEEEESVKLFGVNVKVNNGKKRVQADDDDNDAIERPLKGMKMDLQPPWMKSSCPRDSKICN